MGKNKQQPRSAQDHTPRQWFRVENLGAKNQGGQSSADVYIYDVVGGWFGIGASDFADAVNALDVDQINLHVNSPGGDVFDGIAIRNVLANHPANVSATVDGLAASIASVILTGADDVSMAAGSMLMIHDVSVMTYGNAADLTKMASTIDQMSDNVASMYAASAGGTAEDWRALMLEETWYTAQEAVDAGLADSLVEAPDEDEDPSNVFDLSAYAYAGRAAAPKPPIETIRAAALLHPAALRPVAVATDLTESSDPVEEPEEPAQPEKENAVGDQAAVVEETENQAPAAAALTPENIAAIGAAFAAQMQPFFDNFAAINQSGAVPASLGGKSKSKEPSFRDTMRLIAASKSGEASKEQAEFVRNLVTPPGSVFKNSLADISLGDATLGGLINTNRPQWLGELITKVPYSGAWDVIEHEDLLSARVQAFVMDTFPTGGTKSDGGAAVTSSGAQWILETFNAERWAGADSFDRSLKDFGADATALASYFRAQLRNYYIWRDGQLITAMKTGLTAAAAAAVPSGSAINPVMNQILDGVGTVLGNGGGVSNLAVLPLALFKELLKDSREMAPAYLAIDLSQLSGGDIEGKLKIVPDLSATVPAGDVLVGNGAGVTGYELPDSPVQAEALQISIGNVDIGLFGYCLPVVQSVNYFTLVSAAS